MYYKFNCTCNSSKNLSFIAGGVNFHVYPPGFSNILNVHVQALDRPVGSNKTLCTSNFVT